MAKSNQFIKLDLSLVQRYGVEEVAIVRFLLGKSRVLQKDSRGFFGCEISYIADSLALSRPTVRRLCRSAAGHNLIHYEPGKNQNAKPRFKIF